MFFACTFHFGEYLAMLCRNLCLFVYSYICYRIRMLMFYCNTKINDMTFNIHRIPFNRQNPFRYLLASILLNIPILSYFYYIVGALSLGLANYMVVLSLTRDIKNDLIAFGDRVKVEKDRTILYKSLVDFIQFHSQIKTYVRKHPH